MQVSAPPPPPTHTHRGLVFQLLPIRNSLWRRFQVWQQDNYYIDSQFGELFIFIFKFIFYFYFYFLIQSNLSTTTTLKTPKKWSLYIGGRSVKVVQSKFVSKLAWPDLVWPDLVWPLLTGGRCSEVAVNIGLTVLWFIKSDHKIWLITVTMISLSSFCFFKVILKQNYYSF